MAEAYKRLSHVERNRVWTSWSATIPFLLALGTVVATVFWGVFSIAVTAILTVLFGGLGITLIYLGSEHIAILPFVYCHKNHPGKNFVVVRYKTWWGTSRGMNFIWQQAVKILPGIYRLQGKTFEATTGDMFRCPDIFHDNDEYDESEADNDV